MKKFLISYEASCELTVAQLWPDGDEPENPTVDDVEKLIAKRGGYARILTAWDIDYEHGEGSVVEVKP